MLRNRRIVIGVTGGIACYKTCELVRLCVKAGAEVRVAMTDHATRFVRPLTYEALSNRSVVTDTYLHQGEMASEHISLARWGELIVVAPATANCLAKAANGIADDFLTTMLLATYTPVVFVPAMNTAMLNAPATRRNMEILRGYGYTVTPTGTGSLADGETGEGRMLEPSEIMHHLMIALPKAGPLAGRRVMVTAGPTPEPIDPVRVLTNRSSGKMGVALAEIAKGMGADVAFIHGPLSVSPPAGAELVPVETAEQMLDAVLSHLPTTDALVMAAAVADYRPATVAREKIKKQSDRLVLELVPTQDILVEVSKHKSRQVVVGFALETDAVQAERRARYRIERKSLDMIVLNVVGEPGAAFAADTNRVTLIERDGESRTLPLMPKRDVARHIWERVAEKLTEVKSDASAG